MRLVVYCSSSDAVDASYRELAREVGMRIAERGDTLVYGGTALGLMGELAEAVRGGGGHVTGVVPRRFVDRGIEDRACDELITTDGMAGRKQAMIERADAFVALPGGFGTLEELMEVLTLKQLGYHRHAIVMVDHRGFYDPLLELFEHLYELGFAKDAYRGLYHVAADPGELFDHLDHYETGDLPEKWY